MGSTTVIGAVINIVVNILLIKYIGVYAAAISTLVSCLIVYIYRKYKVKDYIKLTNKGLFPYYILTAITIILYYCNTNIFIKIINLLVVAIYAFYSNRSTIKKIMIPMLDKIKKNITKM